MSDRDENSALIALAELKNLEAERVAQEQAKADAKAAAERKAREEIERKAREEAERIAAEEAARLAKAQAEKEAREREERLRLQETELKTRAEQEARLREEQMRLDAQILMTEKKARPLWLTITPIVLGIGLIVGGYFAWTTIESRDTAAAAERAKAAKRDEDNKKALETLMAELNELKSEQERLEKERASLDSKLAQVQDETERQRLLAEKAALDEELEANKAKQSKNKKNRRPKSGGDKTETKKKPAITVTKTDDPLDGL